MDNRRESLDEYSANLEFNALKDELNIILANSGSYDDTADWTSVNLSSSSSHSSKKTSPGGFLSRTSIHEQLFGFGGIGGPAVDPNDLRRRGFSMSEPAVSNFPEARAHLPQMPRSSPGVIGPSYGMPQNPSQMSLASQQSYSGFGDRHHAPPPLDVGLARYNLTPPPPPPNSATNAGAVNGHYSVNPPAYSHPYGNNGNGNGHLGGGAGLPGKNHSAGASTNTIAISPSYHQYHGSGSGSSRVSPPPPAGASSGKENPNLHYRPNRDVQIANLAKAKAEREAAEAAARGEPYTPPPPPMADSQSPKPASEVDLSPKANQKPSITYVYLVTLKTSTVYCLISKDCTIYALSMNELVVFSADNSGGEEIGFVSHIQTMKSFLDQYQLSNEEEATAQLKQIIRAASEEDRKNTAKNRLEESNILEMLFEMNSRQFHLPIVISDVQYQLDRKKLTIVYKEPMEGAAPVDGRELMKELFQMVQTRIVMKKAAGKRSPWDAIRST